VWGPVARHVGDLRLALDVLAGPDPRDPESLPAILPPPAPVGPVRVALLAEPPGGSTDPGVAAVVRQAGAHLAAAGCQVEEIAPPQHELAVQLWHDLLLTDLHRLRTVLDQVMGEESLAFLHAVLDAHPPLTLDAYGELFVRRRALAREWAAFLDAHPVLVTPVWTQPAFDHGWDASHPLDTMELLRPVMPASILGLPAAAVPGGLSGGMPVGVQCTAARFREDVALDAAAVIEAAAGLTGPVEPFVLG
jgi:amidase